MDDSAEKKEKLGSLEADKAQMIARYMSLQDKADSVNEEIYKVCCGVEALNAQIKALKAEMKKAALRPSPPSNGTSHGLPKGGAHPN